MVRNGGTWTEGRFSSFIKSALRTAHAKWGPKHTAKKAAWVSHGKYRCAQCNTVGPATLPPLPGRKRRRNNAAVDHIDPVVNPEVGFTTWDEYIRRMFCEVSNYQILCWVCHTKKTEEERNVATSRKRRLKTKGA